MRYFFDTEFLNEARQHKVSIISLGMVAEDGRSLYLEAVNADFMCQGDFWLRKQVAPHLQYQDGSMNPKTRHPDCLAPNAMAGRIKEFIGDNIPEFWTYYGAFDFVILSHLFGNFSEWPVGWPMLAWDLRQALDTLNLHGVRQDENAVHNALDDALWISETWTAYVKYAAPPLPGSPRMYGGILR